MSEWADYTQSEIVSGVRDAIASGAIPSDGAFSKLVGCIDDLLSVVDELLTSYNVNCYCEECKRKRKLANDTIKKIRGGA